MARDTLHFLTCGHVDDGKSTLIGRLLHDIGVIPQDQVRGALVDGKLDYSRLTDGLEDERTQGITIDAAYRYFRHAGRHFRIADTPGHVQYVRNMAVAAVGSDCALILVDAHHGVREQTLRHSRIAAFFGIRQFILAVNKMDLVHYSEKAFKEIEAIYRLALGNIPGLTLTFIPVSALQGDNLTHRSAQMPWYRGPSVLECLVDMEVPPSPERGVRLPVQSVIRMGERRGYQGMLSGGTLEVGDTLLIADTGLKVTLAELCHSGRPVQGAESGQAITAVLAEEVDLSRGNVLYAPDSPVQYTDGFAADVLWLEPGWAGRETVPVVVKVHHRQEQAEAQIRTVNDQFVEAQVFTAAPLAVDAYAEHPETGLFLLIQPETEKTIGVGTVRAGQEKEWSFAI